MVDPQETASAPSVAPIFSSTGEDRATSPDLVGRYMEIPNELLVQDPPSTVGGNSNIDLLRDFGQGSHEQDPNALNQGEQELLPTYDALTAFADELGVIGTIYPSSVKHLLRQFKQKLPPLVRKQAREVFLEEPGEEGFDMVGASRFDPSADEPIDNAIGSGYQLSSTPVNPDLQNHGGYQGARIYSDQNNPVGPVPYNLPGFRMNHDMMGFSTTDASKSLLHLGE